METTNYLEIRGMHCAACATRIEKVVGKIDGVTAARVNLTTEKGLFTFDNERTGLSEIIDKINKIGFEALELKNYSSDTDHTKEREIQVLKWEFVISALLTLPLAWAMLAHFSWTTFVYVPELFLHPLFQLAVTIPIQFIIGFPFYEGAWKAIKHGSANMDVLVVLSTSTAFFYSHYLTFTSIETGQDAHALGLFYETSAFIITFILLGKWLEAKTKEKTTDAIKQLYRLQTKTATLYRKGKEVSVSVEDISPGEIVLLRPGDKVPVDGEVISGDSTVNEALLTGESMPVEKDLGSDIFAGTINQNGMLKIRVTKRKEDTALSRIIQIVEEAQSSKAPIQHIADKITEVFVPVVLTLAIGTLALWYVVLQPGYLHGALEKAIAVLIIACPCALGLATPTSVMVGSGRAAQSGLLFKEGRFLEMLGKCDLIALDKTGTITCGKPRVTDVIIRYKDKSSFLQIIGAVENTSSHPLAKAIVRDIRRKINTFPEAIQAATLPGYGMKATVNGKKVIIANPKYFRTSAIAKSSSVLQDVRKLEQEGKTVMIVSINSRFAGIIAAADEMHSSSRTAVSRLKRMGMNVMMLTGDNKRAAASVARKTGITEYFAEVTPEKKADIIQNMQARGKKTIMVGDGINDTPALTVADVGIAIGTGSDVAIESGDVTIVKNDLNRVVDAITISKKTTGNIKQNFAWAFLYNILMIPIAMMGLLAPWLAGAAMAFSSVSVVLNSLRLKKVKL